MVSARVASAPPFWRTPSFAALVIAAAGLAAYVNALNTPFVFDDEPSILANPSIRDFVHAWVPPVNGGITVAGRPLLNFSFAVNYAISGTDPWSYHVVNVLIHIAAGVLLGAIVRRTLRGTALKEKFGERANEAALFAALLWTVHPLQTESVTYIVQRAESLMGFFFLLTLWCFVRGVESSAVLQPALGKIATFAARAEAPRYGKAWRALSVVCCAAGMATKEVMAVAPLVVLLYDRTFVAGNFREAWRARRGFYFALAATWLLLAALVLGTGGRGGTFDLSDPHAWWRYDLTQLVALLRYLRLAVWPSPLVIDYGTFWIARPIAVAPHAVIGIGLLVATIVALVRWPALGFLGAWFFLVLAPSSVLPGTIQMIVEHRMYLPLAALTTLVATAGVARWPHYASAVFSVIALALLVATVRRNQDYASAIGLFEQTVAERPGNARAMALLADYYQRAGQLEKSRTWLERANAIEPNVPQVLNNLGSLLVAMGRPDEGIAQLEAALRLAPGYQLAQASLAHAHVERAKSWQAAGRGADAIAELSAAVKLQPGEAELHDRLGAALGRAGRVREALEQFEAALRLDPADENARQNAARARQFLGGK